jgi:hypothetical protein
MSHIGSSILIREVHSSHLIIIIVNEVRNHQFLDYLISENVSNDGGIGEGLSRSFTKAFYKSGWRMNSE